MIRIISSKRIRKLILFLIIFSQAGYLFLNSPRAIKGDTLLNASATLGNSRLSYKAGISGTPAAGATSVNIDTSSNPDNDVDNLFPNDSICFTGPDESGCHGSTSYTVNTSDPVVDADTFTFTPGLAGALAATDQVVATQTGSLVITFQNQTEIPADGDILLTIPAVNHATKPCDGIPDSSSATSTNGFDLGPTGVQIAAGDVSVTGCTDGNWVATETIDCGDAGTDHTIQIDRQNTACAASSTITITIDSSPGLINPAPTTSGHSQGVADVYVINAKTRNGTDVELDSVDVQVAPIEGVLVTANVDDTLNFTIAGISADSGAYCGVTRTGSSPDSTATRVPFGTVSDASNFVDANHQLTVSTNADDGYTVYVEEDDELGLNGAASPNIADTTCDAGTCTHQTSANWSTNTIYGFGYSLENVSGTDAKFLYNESSRTFSAKSFPNIAGGDFRTDSNANIMNNAGPVSGSSVYVCYRLNISGTQEAGLYFNKIKYTAVPTF